MSNGTEWRKIRKFPDYEVSDTAVVRYISTKHIIPKLRSRKGATVMMHRNGWNIEAFVDEIYSDAFPEKRAELGEAA